MTHMATFCADRRQIDVVEPSRRGGAFDCISVRQQDHFFAHLFVGRARSISHDQRPQQRRSLRHLAAWGSSGQIDSTRVSVHRLFPRTKSTSPPSQKTRVLRPGFAKGAPGQGRLAPKGADYALPAVHVSQPAISRIGCANSRMAKAIVADRKMAPTSRVSRGFGSENSWEERGDHVCSCRLMRAGFAGGRLWDRIKNRSGFWGRELRRMSRGGHRSGVPQTMAVETAQ